MHPWHDIPYSRIRPERFVAVVEIAKGSKTKYELDKATGLLRLDRILYTSTQYPANYGMIPRTYADDQDPLDVLILCQEPLMPMCLVDCLPIGLLTMMDGDSRDEKIIAVPASDPANNAYRDIEELPQHLMIEMKHFFEVYKTLEGKQTMVERLNGADAAREAIQSAMAQYKKRFPAST